MLDFEIPQNFTLIRYQNYMLDFEIPQNFTLIPILSVKYCTQTKKPPSITERLSAVRTGLEPVTPCVTGMYSNQLN